MRSSSFFFHLCCLILPLVTLCQCNTSASYKKKRSAWRKPAEIAKPAVLNQSKPKEPASIATSDTKRRSDLITDSVSAADVTADTEIQSPGRRRVAELLNPNAGKIPTKKELEEASTIPSSVDDVNGVRVPIDPR